MASTGDRPEQPIDAAFGAAARRIRLRLGLTQAEVAARMQEMGSGVRQSTLATLERGQRRWNTNYMALLCAALRVDPLDFVVELLPPDAAELVAASKGGPAALALILAKRLA